MPMTKPTSEQVTFLASGTGASQRTVLDKLRDVVSVKDFGAVGDGVADDTANFQAAMTATRVQGGQNPKKLYVPKGTYKITNYLVCGTNQYIEFDQGAVINLVPATNIENTSAFVASNQTNVTLIGNGATINGTRTGAVIEGGAAAFYLYGSDNVRIENFNINDIATDGITITGDVIGSGPCTNVLIENCVVNNCRRNGMSIIHAEGVTVIGGKYANSNGSPAGPYAGIDVEPNQDQWAKNIQIIGVYTENNPGGGLLFVPGSQGNVRGSIYDVTVIGGRSYKDGALASRPAIRFASGNSTYQVSGQVVIRDFIVDSPYGCGVSWDNWDVDKAPPVYLENVTVINPDWSLNTSTNADRTAFVIYTASAQAVTTQGNIFLTNCKSIDTRASARMTWGFVIDCDSGKSVKNITIRDHTTINQVAATKSDGVVSAALKTGGAANVDVVYSTPRTFDVGSSGAIGNYVGQRINVTSSSALTLPFAGDCVGSSYEIQNAAGVNSVTLVVQSGDTIAYPIGVASTNMVIDANALIRLRSMGGTTWRVENIQGAFRRAGMSAKIYAMEYSTAAPASGTWQRGDRVFNSLPAVGTPKSWVCTVGGTPGTWVSEGNL